MKEGGEGSLHPARYRLPSTETPTLHSEEAEAAAAALKKMKAKGDWLAERRECLLDHTAAAAGLHNTRQRRHCHVDFIRVKRSLSAAAGACPATDHSPCLQPSFPSLVPFFLCKCEKCRMLSCDLGV